MHNLILKNKSPNFILLGITFLLLAACTQKLDHKVNVPVNLIPKDTMASLFADFRIMDAAIVSEQKKRKTKVDETKMFMYNSILNKHGVSRERFEESFNYYASRLDEFDEIYADVISLLSKRKADIEEQKDYEEEEYEEYD